MTCKVPKLVTITQPRSLGTEHQGRRRQAVVAQSCLLLPCPWFLLPVICHGYKFENHCRPCLRENCLESGVFVFGQWMLSMAGKADGPSLLCALTSALRHCGSARTACLYFGDLASVVLMKIESCLILSVPSGFL